MGGRLQKNNAVKYAGFVLLSSSVAPGCRDRLFTWTKFVPSSRVSGQLFHKKNDSTIAETS